MKAYFKQIDVSGQVHCSGIPDPKEDGYCWAVFQVGTKTLFECTGNNQEAAIDRMQGILWAHGLVEKEYRA